MDINKLYYELTTREKDALYRRLWEDYVRDDVLGFLEDWNGDIPETQTGIDEMVDNVVNAYVYEGRHDCNLPYWTNIENLCREYNK